MRGGNGSTGILALGTALLLGLYFAGSGAAECVDYDEHLHWITAMETPGEPQAVEVQMDKAFVAAGSSGLLIVDIGSPEEPSLLGGVDLSGPAQGVAVSGLRAYVAAGYGGLQVIGIWDPSAPVVEGGIVGLGSAKAVRLWGGLAYVVGSYSGLYEIDVSSPSAPSIVRELMTPGDARDLLIDNYFAFVADGYGGLQIIDRAAPDLAIIETMDLGGAVKTLGSASHYLYAVVEGVGLQVIDIGNPYSPHVVYNISWLDGLTSIRVVDDTLCASEPGRLRILDLTNPAQPIPVASSDINTDYLVSLAISNGFAYIVDGSHTFHVFALGDGREVSELGSIDTGGGAQGVCSAGNMAYLANGHQGLAVLDLTDPMQPILRGEILTQDWAYSVALSGNFACVAEGAEGIQVVDVSDPNNPEIVGTAALPGSAKDIVVFDDLAYVAALGDGLLIVDISEPAIPALVGSLVVGGESIRRVVVADGRAFLATYPTGLLIVDVSSPSQPTEQGALATPGRAYDVEVRGSYAYVADYEQGLHVIDVSNPNSPWIVGSAAMPSVAYRVAVSGPTAYVADLFTGLYVVDVSVPSLPRLVGQGGISADIEGVDAGDDHVLLAQRAGSFQGLRVFPLQCGDQTAATSPPVAPATLSAQPNPFNPSTRLRFVLDAPSRARLRVVDATGRFVAELAAGDFGAGEHSIDWDGRDAAGHPVASGVYLARLELPDADVTEKLVLIR